MTYSLIISSNYETPLAISLSGADSKRTLERGNSTLVPIDHEGHAPRFDIYGQKHRKLSLNGADWSDDLAIKPNGDLVYLQSFWCREKILGNVRTGTVTKQAHDADGINGGSSARMDIDIFEGAIRIEISSLPEASQPCSYFTPDLYGGFF